MLIGFFEGIENERGIAWRVADSLCLRAGKRAEQAAVYANRQRIGGHRGNQLLRRPGELVERTFAHALGDRSSAAIVRA
jgi:hypothetical protein